MLNKVLTSLDRLDYNKGVAVERNDLGHLMMYLVPIIGEFDQVTSLSGFFIDRHNPQGGLASGLWFRTHPRKRLRLMTRRRVSLQTASQEQSSRVILAIGPRKVALWKCKSDLMGAVVSSLSRRWLKLDGDHPLVLSYCLKQSRPQDKRLA
jgi:hypothetical protein